MPASDHVDQMLRLGTLGNVVPGGYVYRQKLVTPGEDLRLTHAYLKWYDIRYPDAEIPAALDAETRTFVAAEAEAGRLSIDGELGFVLAHLCEGAHLLMVNTWRNTNEIWEAAYAKDLTRAGGFVEQTATSSSRATFCVWELAPVWHERHAWVRFLSSLRDDAAKQAYVDDRFSGLV